MTYCDGKEWDPSTAKVDDADADDEDALGNHRMLLRKEEAIQKLEKLQIKAAAEDLVQRARARLDIA